MKTVYIVRHGQSENNAARRFNSHDTSLSEKGKKQAAEIAERAAKLPVEIIIASTAKRAQQTAAVVAEKTGAAVESSDLFREGMYASRLFGKEIEDPEVKTAVAEYHKNFTVPGYRLEDGENFDDLKKRALAALDYLAKRPESEILVISHAFFLWILSAAAIFGPELSAEECHGIMRGFDLPENTSLTVLTYGAPMRKTVGEATSPWQFKVWNDHAHLG